jgi:hypothetical protein
VVFTPLTLLEKLAALIPPPRAHLVIYEGVLAANAALRDEIVPQPLSRKKRRVAEVDVEGDDRSPRSSLSLLASYRRRYAWAELIKRVFLEDLLQCECGARREVIALITEPSVIGPILTCLGWRAKHRPSSEHVHHTPSNNRSPNLNHHTSRPGSIDRATASGVELCRRAGGSPPTGSSACRVDPSYAWRTPSRLPAG